MFGFLTGLAVLTCILFGLAPAIRASGGAPVAAMRGSRTSTASRERNGLRRTLVVSQVALSLVLLVAALLFSRSLQRLLATNIGFDSRNVLIASVTADGPAFTNQDKRNVVFQELEARIDSLPNVHSAAPVYFTPFSGSGWNGTVHADDDSGRSGGKVAWFNGAGPGYFATMETRLIGGRGFTRQDDLNAPPVAIVNKTFAKTFFRGRNPVGRSFRVEEQAGKADRVYQVVGQVEDTKYGGFAEEQRSIAFFPVNQDKNPGDNRTFVIRGRDGMGALQSAIQRAIAGVNSSLLVDFRALDVQIQDSLLRERLMANLSVAFGVLAACLSMLGLHGVMSYMVARRRNEIGVRFALGATRSNVYQLIARDAASMVAIGLVVGITASLFLSRYAESLLFELKGRDPMTLVLAGALLALTAAVATLFPARRAARVQPMTALREE